MTLRMRTTLAVLLAAATPALARAQGDSTVRRLHIGSTKVASDTTRVIPDSILRAAVASFNRAGGMKVWGSSSIPPGPLSVPLLAYGGKIRLEGSVDGDVVVINGDLLVANSARISGNLTVLGGQLIVEPGAEIRGAQSWYADLAPVSRAADNTLVIHARGRSLAEIASSNVSVQVGPIAVTLDPGIASYNRAEGLVPSLSPHFAWRRDERTVFRLDLTGVLRTASDPSGIRPNLGWSGRLSAVRSGGRSPLTVGLGARQLVAPMADQAFSALESSLSTLLFHEDYRDWYARKGAGLFADWRMTTHTSLHGSFDIDREGTVRAAAPFSVLRNSESWRANPLADDGKFHRLALGVELDSRDDSVRTAAGWWIRATVRRVSSGDLSPLSLPTSIRAQLPFSGYASSAIELDVRRYLQLGPVASLHLRALARGWIGGDPLLVQDRVSMGGGDAMPGYVFRDGNCDNRRTPDPSRPALCDRQVALQAEYHRELDLNIATRIGRYTIGLDHPSLVLLANTGSAWLSGDSAGRVPSNRIQTIGEWRSDVGVGLDNRWIAVYLTKSLANAGPVRLLVRLRPRF